MPLSIGQILVAAWPAVVRAMCGPQYDFADYALKAMQQDGRIKFRTLGPAVEHNGIQYPVEELSIPMIWTQHDDEANSSESQRIALVKSLCENAIHSHDYLLLNKIGGNSVIVSMESHYELGLIRVIESQGGPMPEEVQITYMCKLYTVFAVIP